MFGRKKPEVKIRKLSEISALNKAKASANNMSKAVEKNLAFVQKMDKKTYLKYYISVLEKQINEAQKILNQKRMELRRLR